MTWALLAVTAVVVGVTIYVATSRPRRPPIVDKSPPISEAEEVLALARRLMRTAADLGPRGGPDRAVVYERARDLMQAFVRTHRSDVQVRPYLAELFIKMGQPEQAEKIADELLDLRPGWAEALWTKGLALRAEGKPQYEPFLRQAAETPDAGAAIWSRWGLELLGRRQFQAAETYLLKARQAGARDGLTLCGLARFALQRKEFQEAEDLLAQAVRDEAAGPAAWRMLASVQKDLGQLEEAADSIQKGLVAVAKAAADPAYSGPDRGDMLMVLGGVRLLQKREPEAAEAFDEASHYSLLEGEAALQAAQGWYLAGRYATALARIDAAARLLPDEPAVPEWKRKIEDAHFPRPGPTSTTSPFGFP